MMVVVISVVCMCSTVSAQDMSARTSYTASCSSTLSVSGTTGTCTSDATGYYGETTKIVMVQYLQKKSASGSWSNVCSWSETDNSYRGYMVRTKYNLSTGTYRLKTVFTVYAGSNSEVLTKYSSSKTV
jgi:hypothetical protein